MASPSTPTYYTLLQYGDDPFAHVFADPYNNLAFTISRVAAGDPNRIIRLRREEAWSSLHSQLIQGPDKSHFFFGAEDRVGVIEYGNNGIRIPMEYYLRPGKKETPPSKYFRSQTGASYKWKILSTHKMECQDSKHATIAVWEVSPPEEENFGRLILRPFALSMVTEILTTLTLNRMAQALGW